MSLDTQARVQIPEKWRVDASFVPKGRYTDPEFLSLEFERLFPRTWLVACRLEEIENVGDFVEFDVADESIIIVRSEDGINAFHNACRHRGNRLAEGAGCMNEFRCTFHGWRWKLDGSLSYVADGAHFDKRPPEDLRLQPVRWDTWGGWVFVTMSPNAEPLLDFLDPMPTRLASYKLEDMRMKWSKRILLNCNWKTAIDAFVEAYHVAATHAQLLQKDRVFRIPTVAQEKARGLTFNETFRYHTRMADDARFGLDGSPRHTKQSGGTNPREILVGVDYALRELRALYLESDRDACQELIDLHDAGEEVTTATYADLRIKHAKAAGMDVPDLTDDELRNGMYDWNLFPNVVLLVDLGCAIAYRARPSGRDHESCWFDVTALQLPTSGGMPKASVQRFEDWREADLGEILNQDVDNMAKVTAGMRSNSFKGQFLNTKQEMAIVNYHRAMDEFIFGEL